MKTLSLEQMETTEGGKFWGKEYDCDTGGPWCDVYQCYFWVCTYAGFFSTNL